MSLGSWADAAVHDYYQQVQTLRTLVGRRSPLMDMLSQSAIEGGSTGEFFTLGGGMGIAGTLSAAQEVASQEGTDGAGTAPGANTHDGEWLIPTGQIETSLVLKYKNLVKAKTNKGAYIRNLTHSTDKHVEAFGERLIQVILGPSGYHIGQADMTDVSDGTLTLMVESNIANFHKGMILVASSNDASSAAHTLLPSNANPAKGYVLEVDRDAGTITVSDTRGSTSAQIPAGWGNEGADIYLFPVGQFRPTLPGSSLTNKLMIQPIEDWITASAASDTFNNVDRSVDSALSGVRVPTADIAHLPPDHKIGYASAYMQSRYAGHDPLTFVYQTEKWFELVRSLQAQGVVKDIGSILSGGARKVEIMTVNGMATVLAEPHQRPDFAFGLDPRAINIYHLDGLPGVANADGLEMLRQADSNDLEFRLLAFPQLVIREPWRHCRFAT